MCPELPFEQAAGRSKREPLVGGQKAEALDGAQAPPRRVQIDLPSPSVETPIQAASPKELRETLDDFAQAVRHLLKLPTSARNQARVKEVGLEVEGLLQRGLEEGPDSEQARASLIDPCRASLQDLLKAVNRVAEHPNNKSYWDSLGNAELGAEAIIILSHNIGFGPSPVVLISSEGLHEKLLRGDLGRDGYLETSWIHEVKQYDGKAAEEADLTYLGQALISGRVVISLRECSGREDDSWNNTSGAFQDVSLLKAEFERSGLAEGGRVLVGYRREQTPSFGSPLYLALDEA